MPPSFALSQLAALEQREHVGRNLTVDEEQRQWLRAPWGPLMKPLAARAAGLLQDAREEKALLLDVAHATGHLLTELAETVAGQQRARARLQRDEHVAWQSLLKAHRSVHATALLDAVWREHHDRIGLYLTEQEAWHAMMQSAAGALHSLVQWEARHQAVKTEAVARRDVEKEEWMLFYQVFDVGAAAPLSHGGGTSPPIRPSAARP